MRKKKHHKPWITVLNRYIRDREKIATLFKGTGEKEIEKELFGERRGVDLPSKTDDHGINRGGGKPISGSAWEEKETQGNVIGLT